MQNYADRLTKLFQFVYPIDDSVTTKEILAMRERIVMDKFIDRLQPDFKKSVKYKDFNNFELKETEEHAVANEEFKLDKKKVNFEFVNSVGLGRKDTISKTTIMK